jgi:isoquinoline 1-oxidoreductase beta subunit
VSGRSLTRRHFLEVTGGAGAGLVLAFHLPGARRLAAATSEQPVLLNAWIRIGTDESVTFLVSESEMGQGVLTSMSMLLAEELSVDWSGVRAVHAPADREAYGRQSTGGSTSVRTNYERLRVAGAAAREMLVAAAAAAWGVPAAECRAQQGRIVHGASRRSVTYGAVADAAAALEPPSDPALRPPSEFTLIGTRVPRIDTPPKVDGAAAFGLDVSMPGMLTALVARPPAFGGSVKRFDPAPALAVPGVRRVVEIPAGVVVAADSFWSAKKGRDALDVEWEPGPLGPLSDERIREICREKAGEGRTARDDGDVEAALASAATRLEAVYEVPYLAHATMEPMNCTADVRPDGCDIWTGTQAQTSAQDMAAEITGLPVERIRVRTMMLGGGFGRRSRNDFVREAVHASKALGAPVKVVFTREDDMRAGSYRPMAWNELSAGLDEAGRPVAWEHRIASPSILRDLGARLENGIDATAVESAGNLPYAIPNLRVTYADPELPVPVHFWRSVGNSQNVFVTECFLDELAEAAAADPVEFRVGLLAEHPRRVRALRRAAETAGWGRALPASHGLGCAVSECFGSVIAQVAEVAVADDGSVRVPRVVCAVDCGSVVNPDTIEAQMESGVVYALSATLFGKISIADGGAVEGNFDDHPILRFRDMPRVETVIIAEGDPIGGIGELGVPALAPAVCNAVFAATGRRVRRLPIGQVTIPG